MSSYPAVPEPGKTSRLAPEPVARRDFLGLAALWSAGATLLFALIGLLRLPKAAVLPSPSKRFSGCVVKTDSGGFHCPCHGSRFGPDGVVVAGPAPKALPWLAVKQKSEGVYIVDEGKVVKPGTRELA